uniref:RUN and FYVE domain-containing protein 1 n=1 Tax=Pyxicephalus adspersus TaxID=30357 RepID=A0AAV3ANX6_PYXAD|nr:TPA: hypothetical protein GDO54_006718 [Pyxicephalus adspersus]
MEERTNLMNMMKISIKVLIQSALTLGRCLDSEYPPLQQFFCIMEHCLKHGLKVKKSFIGQNKSFFGPLELVEKLCPESSDIFANIKNLPEIKTAVGRGRAWLHLSLMQKKLADYLQVLIDHKHLLSDFYEPEALMLEEEGAVILKVGVIDFSFYLKDIQLNDNDSKADEIANVLDQKHYVEELNRHLSCTVADLQSKVELLEKTNAKISEELIAAKDRIVSLQGEHNQLLEENIFIKEKSERSVEVNLQDTKVELETYKQSRQGLDEMYNEIWKQLKVEKQARLEQEKELELQLAIKTEMEMAMKLLEKDIHEKQDSLIILRKQLDDVKSINLQMCQKVKEAETALQKKTDSEASLKSKLDQTESETKLLEERSKLKMEDIKEVNKALKHHCRNCGHIFCNTCSSNELSLPSYPKPVRVCDTCHNLLLQRCSSNCS